MRKWLPVVLCGLMFSAPLELWAQTAPQPDDGRKNACQARTILDEMVQALGGEAWLKMKNQTREGHMAAFFQGKPSGGTTPYWEFHAWPDQDRIEYTKHRDVVQFYLGRTGIEVTYKGKTSLPQEQVDDYLLRRDHSIETAVKLWLNDPRTLLIYDGQRLTERHQADQVTLISAANEAVTILIDVQSHLPLRRSFEWRDPVYKDENVDVEEYDDYHTIDGFPTPFTITRFRNGEMVQQYFTDHVSYNQELPEDFWSVDAADKRILK